MTALPGGWASTATGCRTGPRLLAPGTSGGIYGLVALANGDIAAVGDTENADGQIHAALHRIGPDGEVRWNAVVDTGAGTTYGISAVEMPGGDIVLGVEGLDAAEQPYAMAIRATADGQELWRQPIPDLEDLAGLVLQADGSLLAVGNKDAGAGNEIRLVALAADGSSRLHATMAGNGAMSAYRARPLPGGDILLAIDMTGADDSPGAMLRLGADGTVRWLRQIAAGAGLVENMQVLPGPDGSAATIAVAGALVAEDGEQGCLCRPADGGGRMALGTPFPRPPRHPVLCHRGTGGRASGWPPAPRWSRCRRAPWRATMSMRRTSGTRMPGW